jgi:hypothetical protein
MNAWLNMKARVWKGTHRWWAEANLPGGYVDRFSTPNNLSRYRKDFGSWNEAIAWALNPRQE